MAPKLRFTEATPEQAALHARMIRRAFRPQAAILGVNKVDHPYQAAFHTAALTRRRMGEGAHVVIAWLGEQPVGTVTYVRGRHHPDDGWIERLAVLPEFRGRRYGEALMAHAEQRLRKLGAQTLRLAIVKPFSKLQAFYEGQGYAAAETRQFPGVPFAVLFMEKLA
jgi:GNAT superfamily N-acetyltransferase